MKDPENVAETHIIKKATCALLKGAALGEFLLDLLTGLWNLGLETGETSC